MSASGDPARRTRRSGLTRPAAHTPSQDSDPSRAEARPEPPPLSFACLTLLGYSKPDPVAPGRRSQSFTAAYGRGGSGSLPRCLLGCGGRRGMKGFRAPGEPAAALPDPKHREPSPDVETVPSLRPRGRCSEGACVCVCGGGYQGSPWVPSGEGERRPPSPLPNTYVSRLRGGGVSRPLPTHTPLRLSTPPELQLRNPGPRAGRMGRDAGTRGTGAEGAGMG